VDSVVQATPVLAPSQSAQLVSNQKINQLCDQAIAISKQGGIQDSIEMLSKTPLMEKGAASARARLLLAGFYLKSESLEQAMDTLEKIDLPSADLNQRVEALELKAEIFRRKGKYGYAIDQYINMEVMTGLTPAQRNAATTRIQELQDEALQLQKEALSNEQ
jgi:outer membrane PBP1 activator LpoA protein